MAVLNPCPIDKSRDDILVLGRRRKMGLDGTFAMDFGLLLNRSSLTNESVLFHLEIFIKLSNKQLLRFLKQQCSSHKYKVNIRL